MLFRKWTTKVLIRLCGCSGLPVPLLFPCGINRFSHDMAEIYLIKELCLTIAAFTPWQAGRLLELKYVQISSVLLKHFLSLLAAFCFLVWMLLTSQPFRGTRDLAFCLKVPLHSMILWANSGGSGETAQMRRLTWTFAAGIGDKYWLHFVSLFECCLTSLSQQLWSCRDSQLT